MEPEEAADRLVAFLDAQAEVFRGRPEVWFQAFWYNVGNAQRRFFRIMAVGPDMKIEGLDIWVRRAARVPIRNPPRDGEYSAETGFRSDYSGQDVAADVYDLLLSAISIAKNGPQGVSIGDYMRNIVIKEVN